MTNPDWAHAPRLDQAVLDQVRQLSAVRPGLLANLVHMFETNTLAVFGEAEAKLASGDFEWLRITYHSLKGTSASLGARRMSMIARDLEEAASQGKADAMPPLMQQIAAEFQEVRTALAQEIAK